MLLIRSRDVELNSGPKKSYFFFFFHWNNNGITVHDFFEMGLIQSHAFSHNTDVMFLSETFLDSSTEANGPKINIPGYNLLRSDHLSNTKKRWYLHVLHKIFTSQYT